MPLDFCICDEIDSFDGEHICEYCDSFFVTCPECHHQFDTRPIVETNINEETIVDVEVPTIRELAESYGERFKADDNIIDFKIIDNDETNCSIEMIPNEKDKPHFILNIDLDSKYYDLKNKYFMMCQLFMRTQK